MRIGIVGAGIFGASAALELARRGHDVVLVDKGPVPHPDASSTDISKLVRLDYGADAFYTELMERALAGWRELNEGWERPLFHETGIAVLSSEPLAPGSFELESLRLLEARAHSVERLDAVAIRERFPQFCTGRYVDGYFNPQGGWAESGEVVRRFVQAATEAGVRLLVGQIELSGDRVHVQGRPLDVEQTVIAAGAFTPLLLPELAPALAVVGQPVTHFAPEAASSFAPPSFVPWAADIASTGWYGFPVTDRGVVKVANHGPGVVTDPRGPRPLPEDAEARCRAFAAGSLPRLAEAKVVGGRLCLYCDSFDGDLWIARHPEREDLVVAAGGSGHGFKFAPLLGAMIADEVEERSVPAVVARFGWRSVTRRRREAARHAPTR